MRLKTCFSMLMTIFILCSSVRAQQPDLPQLETPQIARRPITVTGQISRASSSGVIVAQGGREHGYAVHLLGGRLIFDVRVNRTVTRLTSPHPVPRKFSFTATLTPEEMQLHVNGLQIARRRSAGLIPLQPGDGLSVGRDELSAAGDYRAPNPFRGTITAVDVAAGSEVRALRPVISPLTTPWGEKVTAENAWTEYPRPLLQRKQWTCLNGHWDYCITEASQVKIPSQWTGKLLVPFCPESRLGGVQRLLNEVEALWYRRWFTVDALSQQRCILNFEAVDYECEVLVNRQSVGRHTGGHTPFHFDITEFVREGSNELVVRVTDQTEAWQLRGKQSRNPRGIWYTRVSGIWQTVWLEMVPDLHMTDLRITPDAERGAVAVEASLSAPGKLRITVSAEQQPIATVSAAASQQTRITSEITIPSARLWSPADPYLYDLKIEVLAADGTVMDTVRSYAGIRSVGRARDADGHWRFTLNGQRLFHWGTLDQGWWPDGLLTPPSDEAMRFDIEWLKSAGFNMIRKHIKVEPRRYYYHCDRLGMLVWQDHVSGSEKETWPEWTRLAPDPVESTWPVEEHQQFLVELDRMITSLENHPSIVCWVPLNERWGQHRTIEIGEWTTARDPSRLVNVASGGNFFPTGHIVDAHKYPHPEFPFDQGQGGRFEQFIKVMGEFGGHGLPIEGHLWAPDRRNWGYGELPQNPAEYRDRYLTSLNLLNDLRHRGIAAGVYTQTTDVEGEINGLMTYDRRVVKIPAAELAAMHQRLFED